MISLIVAYSKENRVIGKNGKIPWALPEDMKHFKKTTEGNVVIMGRKTWDSLPQKFKPLANRINIVLSNRYGVLREQRNLWYMTKLEKALEFCNRTYPEHRVFIIGGQSVYEQALEFNIVDEIIATEIHKTYEGDIFFPELGENWKGWTLRRTDEFNIVIYQKVKNE